MCQYFTYNTKYSLHNRNNSDLLSKIHLNYTFYLFRMNINNVFFYSANPINTSTLKIN